MKPISYLSSVALTFSMLYVSGCFQDIEAQTSTPLSQDVSNFIQIDVSQQEVRLPDLNVTDGTGGQRAETRLTW